MVYSDFSQPSSEGQQPFMAATSGCVLLSQAQGWGIQQTSEELMSGILSLGDAQMLLLRYWPTLGLGVAKSSLLPLPHTSFIPSPTQPEQHAQDKRPPSSSHLLFPPSVGRQKTTTWALQGNVSLWLYNLKIPRCQVAQGKKIEQHKSFFFVAAFRMKWILVKIIKTTVKS